MNLRHNDAAIDSGCTNHTWPLTAPVQNIQKTNPSAAINVKLPNDQIMAQSHHGTTVTPTGTSALTPESSVLIPILGTSRMQQKRLPEAVAIKNTRRNDDIRRLIIAKI